MKRDYWLLVKKVPAILYGLGIMVLSNQQNLPVISPFSWFDKVEHIIEYLLFTVLVFIGWPKSRYFHILAVLALFAFSDELHQYFVPGRFSSIWDWAADMVGTSMCCGLWYMIRKNERR